MSPASEQTEVQCADLPRRHYDNVTLGDACNTCGGCRWVCAEAIKESYLDPRLAAAEFMAWLYDKNICTRWTPDEQLDLVNKWTDAKRQKETTAEQPAAAAQIASPEIDAQRSDLEKKYAWRVSPTQREGMFAMFGYVENDAGETRQCCLGGHNFRAEEPPWASERAFDCATSTAERLNLASRPPQ